MSVQVAVSEMETQESSHKSQSKNIFFLFLIKMQQ
jgi:hypothetical protein